MKVRCTDFGTWSFNLADNLGGKSIGPHPFKEHERVDISGALHYGVLHNDIVVLERKTPDVIIIITPSRWVRAFL